MRVGIVIRPNHNLGNILTDKLKEIISKSKHEFIQFGKNQKIKDVDLVVVFGGDGSILGVAREAGEIPIYPINIGNLGFLTQPYIVVNDLEWILSKFETGQYTIDKRSRLQVECQRNTYRSNVSVTALNDVIVKGAVAKLIRLDLFVDNKMVAEFPADGLIVATATGSTAYSLSAGGPIITPDAPVNIVTPICSHMLNLRSMIVRNDQEIKIKVKSNRDIVLSVDGQLDYDVHDENEIIIKQAEQVTNIVRIGEYEFFNILSQSMGWGKKNQNVHDAY